MNKNLHERRMKWGQYTTSFNYYYNGFSFHFCVLIFFCFASHVCFNCVPITVRTKTTYNANCYNQFRRHATKMGWSLRYERLKDFMAASTHTVSMIGTAKTNIINLEHLKIWYVECPCNGSINLFSLRFIHCCCSCFFRGSGGTVNVLRISGTQGYPECGTQRVRVSLIFIIRHGKNQPSFH